MVVRGRTAAEKQHRVACGVQRVFRLHYGHDGRDLVAEVGELAEVAPSESREVGAIFEAGDSYVIWPFLGSSRVVPNADKREVVYFGS
jgi:hypothetical protein